jgi:plastocyanin
MVASRTGTVLAGAVLATALSAALLLATAADARRRVPTTAVGVGAREYRYAVYRASVPRGVVVFDLTNYGQDGHDLVIETRGRRVLARTGKVRSGARASLRLRLAPGTYRLVCDLANHAALGMRTTLRVTR